MNVKREEMLMKLGAARSKSFDRMASGRSRARQGERRADLLPQSPETADCKATGGAPFAAHESDRQGSGRPRQYYVQLVAVEEAFKNLKGDLAIRPIFHHDESRIEAHIFIAFLAYALGRSP